ncbi:MAG: deoxynucleoside kinase, partial [Lachnospiraceae bacterium]|nr:deoxynucleoside kinase [Lachnospiraceae bacterium]
MTTFSLSKGMQEVTLMKKLLLITGDIAAGKSTFSKILSERYGVAVFQKDTVKEILGDHIGFHNREENKALSNA